MTNGLEKHASDPESTIDDKESKAKEEYVYNRRERVLDPGDSIVRKRKKFYQIWLPKHDAPPPPATLAEAPIIPLATASWLSVLTFSWITPIMELGYARTLQATDLYAVDESRSAEYLSMKLEEAWAARVKKADEWNARLDRGEIKPGLMRKVKWWAGRNVTSVRRKRVTVDREGQEREWRKDMRKAPSLAWALNDVLKGRFWSGGVYKVFGDMSQLMMPLVARAIITFAQDRYVALHASPGQHVKHRSIVEGIFMAIGLFLLSNFQNFGQQHFFWRSMSTGVLARAALIASVYKRGVYLTPSARKSYDNSRLLHMVSGDISRIDSASQWFHAAWTAPIQVTVCLIILLVQLGPTALIGFTLFVILVPFQEYLMKRQMKFRKAASGFSDDRMSLLGECFCAMKVVKWFCYENRFLERISAIRAKELHGVWKIELNGAINLSVAFSVPTIAAVLSFSAYLLTKKEFNVAIIFSSLTLFNMLRQPLMFLPRAISGIADARSALARLTPLFSAELNEDGTLDIDQSLASAVRVQGAVFAWEQAMSHPSDANSKRKGKSKGKSTEVKQNTTSSIPFSLPEISFEIPRGTVAAIVGPVGSGKSSLLQGLVGEMTRKRGSVKFGGKIAYCSQVAWIQNATLRENVLFGETWDEGRYWKAIETACLMPDVDVLPERDLTEIGEKGINLSGGQKQRINIARALYCDADVVIMDDPLSAVDAHVGKALFNNAIMGHLRSCGKTVILVTHALHFVSGVDYIYTLQNGRISEQGTYDELMGRRQEFYRLVTEHGGSALNEKREDQEVMIETQAKALPGRKSLSPTGQGTTTKETRSTGSVPWRIYGTYWKAGNGWVIGPMVLLSAMLMQASQILNSYVLVWWQANSFHLLETSYAAIYGVFGICQGAFTFALGITMAALARRASQKLHSDSARHIFRAPSSFFDITPLGRLISVFGKDFDSIDNQLTTAIRMQALTLSTCLGAVIIVTILEPYFLIAVFIISFAYQHLAGFYGANAMMRSWLYSHFAESLSGLPTMKAYGAAQMFISDNAYYVDVENRALLLVTTNQRWLSVRLGFLGSVMTFVVGIFAVLGTSGISPAQVGLILTYTTQLTQMLTVVTRQSTDVENYMNAVERVVEYSRGDVVKPEAEHNITDKTPPKSWPENGSIEWSKVEMCYRPGLPTVLKNLTLSIRGGEKIGVVGRTGAGKSSLIMALFRITELSSGTIYIDGVDISKLGLHDLRSKISIIPQEPLLFSGTIRSNLDPFSLYQDTHLWDALRRACLLDTPKEGETETQDSSVPRFTLESVVEPEGLNMSVGQRSLLSLARALVKDSQIVILDEATASVDLDTDAKIQRTIQSEFSTRTLVCIAHRLRTILSYDRILVMDAGEVAEFDTPSELFDIDGGIFRGMCERSNISRTDIEKARLGAQNL